MKIKTPVVHKIATMLPNLTSVYLSAFHPLIRGVARQTGITIAQVSERLSQNHIPASLNLPLQILRACKAISCHALCPNSKHVRSMALPSNESGFCETRLLRALCRSLRLNPSSAELLKLASPSLRFLSLQPSAESIVDTSHFPILTSLTKLELHIEKFSSVCNSEALRKMRLLELTHSCCEGLAEQLYMPDSPLSQLKLCLETSLRKMQNVALTRSERG